MHKPTTHFEQIPLETIREIIEQCQSEAATGEGIEAEQLETEFARVEDPSMADLSIFLKR